MRAFGYAMCCWLGWDISNLIFMQDVGMARLAISVGLGVLAVTLVIKDED